MKIISDIFEQTAQAVTDTKTLIPTYMADHPEFCEIGERMINAWDEGLKDMSK
jgi:serine/threonine-protein kinase HipA